MNEYKLPSENINRSIQSKVYQSNEWIQKIYHIMDTSVFDLQQSTNFNQYHNLQFNEGFGNLNGPISN